MIAQRYLLKRNMTIEYTGKYKKMAEQFRADGCDEYTVEKFIREEMEADEWKTSEGTTDFVALKEWGELPEKEKHILLTNAYCSNCGVVSFAPGYNIRKDKWGLVIEGTCTKCGKAIARARDV